MALEQAHAGRLNSCLRAVGWLFLAVALCVCGTGSYGYSTQGQDGLFAAIVAGLLCFVSAAAALLVTGMTAGSSSALAGSFVGIALRTAVPLLGAILLVQASTQLAEAGLFGKVLVSYLVVLAVETVLAVRLVQAHSVDGGSAVNG